MSDSNETTALVEIENDRSLALIYEAERSLAKAKTIPEVKAIIDASEALRTCIVKAKKGLVIQNHCAEIKLRAERKAGVILQGMGFGDHGGNRKSSNRVLLEDLDISRMDSHRWQLEAGVDDAAFEEYIAQFGQKGEITSAGLIRIAKNTPKEQEVEEPEDGGEGLVKDFDDPEVRNKMRRIYVDPPWRYGDMGCSGGLHGQYATMAKEEICAMPVWKLIHNTKGAHLWMWTTWPMMRDGVPHDVLKAWGFRWVGEILWVKPGLGVGRWLRPSTEILILAVCEKNAPLLRKNQKGHQEAPRVGHSRKPECFYELIESLSPGPGIELFARRERDGWFRWGKEA